jgi:hypothetical protein
MRSTHLPIQLTALASLALVSFVSLGGCDHMRHRHADGPHLTEAAIAIPIRAGQTEAWQQALAELTGPRYAEYDSSRRRMGLTSQTTFLQRTPRGDLALIHLTGPDIYATFDTMANSEDPWDVRWRALTQDLHGLDFAEGAKVQPKVEPLITTDAIADGTTRAYMFAVPVADDQVATVRALAPELGGARRDAYLASHRALGIAREAAFLETSGLGHLVVVYWQAKDP